MKDKPKETTKPASSPAVDWTKRHLWQIQWVRDLLVLFTIIGLLLLGEKLSLVTVPALLAMLFAYLFEPIVKRLSRVKGISRRLATGGIVVVTALLVVIPVLVGLGFGILQGATFARGIASQTSAVIASTKDPNNKELLDDVGDGAWLEIRNSIVDLKWKPESERSDEEPTSLFGVDRKTLSSGLNHAISWVRDNADQTATTVLGTSRGAFTLAVSTISSVGVFFFGAFLAAFFFFFISAAWPGLVADARSLMPNEDRVRWQKIITRMDLAVHGFVRGRLSIGFVLAGFYTIGFWLIGVPAPLILGPAVAMLALIPYAALLLVPVVTALLWLEGNTGLRGEIAWVLLAPLVLYQVGQMLDDYLLTPLIQGKSTNLDTPTILFASIAGGILLGFFGLLVAIPLAACAKILIKEVFWPRVQGWLRGHEKDFLPLDR